MPMMVQCWKRQVFIPVPKALYYQIKEMLNLIDSGELNDEEGHGRFKDLVGHLLPPDHDPVLDHTNFILKQDPTFVVPREYIN